MESQNQVEILRLGDFILEKMERILVAWEDFARRFWRGPPPDSATLRDDAEAMLRALVEDMATSQSATLQKSKSEGSHVGRDSAMNRAAIGHALSRLKEGFDIERMVAEFRALRASVSRIWWESAPTPHREQIEDMERFNEALDELLAASVTEFTERVNRSRRLFLGILGHDLRQPLNSMRMFTEIAKEESPPAEARMVLSRMENCCDSMAKMLSDLLDLTTSQLDGSIPVQPTASNLEAICREVVNEVRATAPGRSFDVEAFGDLDGEWDELRLRQLISNLLSNAIQHGSADEPIITTLRGSDDDVTLAVQNMGQPIPQESMKIIFDPMVRLSSAEKKNRPQGSVGLGLYICRMIAVAHGGEINVESSVEKGTTFTVTLPKRFAVPGSSSKGGRDIKIQASFPEA